MAKQAVQDHYPDELAHCYGCGRLNEDGLRIKSYWERGECVCIYSPRDSHIAIPGFVYGGLIASLIDCHANGTAALASYRAEGRGMDTDPPFRYVTAALHVDYKRPTPLGVPLKLRARVKEMKGRKAVITVTLTAKRKVRALGGVVVVQMPENMAPV